MRPEVPVPKGRGQPVPRAQIFHLHKQEGRQCAFLLVWAVGMRSLEMIFWLLSFLPKVQNKVISNEWWGGGLKWEELSSFLIVVCESMFVCLSVGVCVQQCLCRGQRTCLRQVSAYFCLFWLAGLLASGDSLSEYQCYGYMLPCMALYGSQGPNSGLYAFVTSIGFLTCWAFFQLKGVLNIPLGRWKEKEGWAWFLVDFWWLSFQSSLLGD